MSHKQPIIFRWALASVLLAAALGVPAAPLSAQQPAPAAASAALLVGLKPGARLTAGLHGLSASDSALTASLNHLNIQSAANVFPAIAGSSQVRLAGLASPIDLRAVYRLRLPAGADVAAALSALQDNPAVVYAEPDGIAHLITTPNDPLLAQQWGLAQIGAPGAWSVITGSASVAIAVIDSGIDFTHPDLAGQLWTNPGEIAGNSLDDDNNGHVDDIHGWNLLNNDADLSDNNGHGTEVAGIAAAATDNGLGVAGVCWTCKLMVVKVAQPSGVANYSDIAAGVAYAAQKGAKVINLSLGGNSDSITLRAAIASAAASAVIVGGAGNDNSSALFYPAAYPDVLAVAGTTITDTKVASSNFGSWVDVTAPGEAITTTFSGSHWGASSGTSLAAPFASGLAGLLFSQHPGWSPAQVRAQIVHTAHNIDAGNPSYAGQLGSGRIDAASAVTTAATPVVSIQAYSVNGLPNGTPDPGTLADVSITLYNDWGPASNLQASLTGGGAHASVVSSTASYGTLDTYHSQSISGALRISITAAAGFGASLPFTLHLTADGGYAASLPLTINTAPNVTYEQGTLNTQIWTANRVYIITNNTTVGTGQTLTIEPGTIVRFAGSYSLSIAGTLIADGTAQQPIQFTKLITSANWNSIQFLDTSVDAAFDGSGAYVSGSILRHAWIDTTSTGGVGLTNAGPYLAQNEIDSGGINGTGSATLVIAGNTLAPSSLAVTGGARMVGNTLTGGGIAAAQFDQVISNTVQNGAGAGIAATQVLTVSGNRVTHSAVGIAASAGLITDNLLSDDAIGLSIGGAATVVSNTVLGSSDTGVDLSSATAIVRGNNLLPAPGHFALRNDAGASITVTVPANWWGTTNTAAIDAIVDDNHDDSNLGFANYNGFLSGPSVDAPAYVPDVAIGPDTTLGIQTGTFDAHFSRPMDQNINPGLDFYSIQRGSWTEFDHTNSGPGKVLVSRTDVDGAVWFGTDSSGVARYDGSGWTVYSTGNSVLQSNHIEAMAIDANGTKWFGMDRGQVARLAGTTWTTYTIPGGNLPGNQVRGMAVDTDGTIWFATVATAVVHFDGVNWTIYNSSNTPLPNSSAFSVYVDKNGNKWFGLDQAVARFDGLSWTIYNPTNSGLPGGQVSGLTMDGAGRMWFSIYDTAIASYDGSAWQQSNIANTPTTYREMTTDQDGSVWVAIADTGGTGGVGNFGLAHFDGSSWTVFDPSNTGLPLGGVSIGIDQNGNKWAGNNTGVARLYQGLDHPITGHGQWLDDHTWRATYDFTSIIPRGAYSLSVTGAVGLDGIEIAPAAITFTVDYAGQITDQTPPAQPFVFADGAVGNAGFVTARWQATDPNSPIIHYRYAIGSTRGALDIVNWTSIDLTSVTRNGLGLVGGQHYWVSVQAQNQGGLWSPVGGSGFTAGAKNPRVFLPVVSRK